MTLKPDTNWISLITLSIKPEEWSVVSESERVMIVSLGHILNEINLLNKFILIFQEQGSSLMKVKGDSTEWKIRLDANALQALFITMILAGKLCETAKYLNENIMSNDWFNNYKAQLSAKTKNKLEQYLKESPKNHEERKNHPLTILRDLAGFHYDTKFFTDVCSKVTAKSDNFFYIARSVGNTLYWSSTEVVFLDLLSKIDANDKQKASDKAIGLAIETATTFKDILGEFLSIALEKYFPNKLSITDENKVFLKNLKNIDDIEIPFFAVSEKDTPESQP